MSDKSFSKYTAKAAELFFLLLTFLMPLKYGTLGCMPEVSCFYPDGAIDYLSVSWPTSTFGVFSGFALLLCCLQFNTKLRFSALSLSALLFAAALPCAALWGKIIAPSSFYGDAVFSHIVSLGAYLAAAYMLVSNNSEFKNKIFHALGAGTFLLTITAFHQYFFGFKDMLEFAKMQESQGIVLSDAIRLKLIDGRVYGAMTSANLLAGFILCTSPLLIGVAAKLSRRFEPQKASLIIFCSVAAVMGFGTLLMTKTRGAFLSLGLAAVLWMFSSDKLRKKYKILLLVLMLAAFVSGALYIKAYGRGFGSMAERVSYLKSSCIMLAEKPLSGHGWGEFFYRHMQLKTTSSNESAHDPHNVVANFAVHTGVFGGLLALAAFIVPLINLWRRRSKLDTLDTLAFWGAVAGFIHALQDINLQSPAVISTLMLLLLITQENREESREISRKYRCAAVIFMVSLGSISCVTNWIYTRGDAALNALEECCRPPVKEKFHLATPRNVERTLAEVNRLRPEHPFAFNLAAKFYAAYGNYSKAQEYFQKAAALENYRRPGPLAELAKIYSMQGKEDEAAKLRIRAHKLFPTNPEYQLQ